MSRQPLSLDQPVGDHDDTYFGEFLQDYREDDPLLEMNHELLKARIADVLEGLDYREREIIRLRYGLADGYAYTLEEVGKIFSVTRERVRQIETKAVRSLQHPIRAPRMLSGFLDHAMSSPMAALQAAGNEATTVESVRASSRRFSPQRGHEAQREEHLPAKPQASRSACGFASRRSKAAGQEPPPQGQLRPGGAATRSRPTAAPFPAARSAPARSADASRPTP